MFFSSLFLCISVRLTNQTISFIELIHPLVFGIQFCPPPTPWIPLFWLNPQVKSNIHRSWDGGERRPVSCSTFVLFVPLLLIALLLISFLSNDGQRHAIYYYVPLTWVCPSAPHFDVFHAARVREKSWAPQMNVTLPSSKRTRRKHKQYLRLCLWGCSPPSECVHTVTFHPWLWTCSYDPMVAVVVVIAETSYRLLYPECSGPFHKCSEAKDNRD